MKGASILGDHVQLPSQTAERSTIYTMAVCCTNYVWPRLMHGAMNHECSRIQESYFSTIDDLSVVVHLDKIAFLDEREGNTERVDPKSR